MGVGGLTQRKVTSAIGAVIDGVDLRQPLTPEAVRFIRQALLDHSVIFFRDQDLDTEQLRAFAKNLGRPVTTPFATAEVQKADPVTNGDLYASKHSTALWHTDTTYVPEPSAVTMLRAVRLPPVGGDTCWSSMYAAYDALSEPMRSMLDGLTAVHSVQPVMDLLGPEMAKDYQHNIELYGVQNIHPVIRVHPETGRKALYVNSAWVTRIVELTPAESRHVLDLLFEHIKSPDFTMRWRWSPNDLAVWDNRCVQHYAVPDYDSERVMQRTELAGDRPRGPAHA
jgi:taurine dioxygenase